MSMDIDGRWVQCEHCHKWRHWICALYDDQQYPHGRPFYCRSCKAHEPKSEQVRPTVPPTQPALPQRVAGVSSVVGMPRSRSNSHPRSTNRSVPSLPDALGSEQRCRQLNRHPHV